MSSLYRGRKVQDDHGCTAFDWWLLVGECCAALLWVVPGPVPGSSEAETTAPVSCASHSREHKAGSQSLLLTGAAYFYKSLCPAFIAYFSTSRFNLL